MRAEWLWRIASHPAESLGAIEEPTRVDLLGRVVSPNSVRSPVSGTIAALVHVTIGEQQTIVGRDDFGRFESHNEFRVVGEALFGETLVVADAQGKTVHVPLAAVAVRTSMDARSLLGAVPRSLRAAAVGATGKSPLMQHELLLRHGDAVRLRAVVAMENVLGAHVYRSPVVRRLVTRADLAPVELVEVAREDTL